jgi:TatD DNase family protein
MAAGVDPGRAGRDPGQFRRRGRHLRRYPGCLPAWGLHPIYIPVHRDRPPGGAARQIAAWRPVAVGEIGLDLFVPELDFATQEKFYLEQLKIARDYDLPVLLHCRRANDQILKHLRRIGVKGGIAHAFNGSDQQAEAFIKLGFKLGFGGAFTWERASNLRRLARELPLEAIVLETDSPDIPPQWVGKGRNEPAELARIAGALAEVRGLSVEEVAGDHRQRPMCCNSPLYQRGKKNSSTGTFPVAMIWTMPNLLTATASS